MNSSENQLLLGLQTTTDNVARVKLIGDLLEHGIDTATIATKTKIPGYMIRHYARITRKLVPEVMELFSQRKISFSLARAIASLPPKQQEKSARDSIAKKISVHKFRANTSGNQDKQLVRDLERMSDRFSEITGLQITIKADTNNPKAGNWIIRYESLDMFDTITEKLLGKSSLEDY